MELSHFVPVQEHTLNASGHAELRVFQRWNTAIDSVRQGLREHGASQQPNRVQESDVAAA